ncbi:MAG: hypothetical protein ABIO02_00675 [Patescibacteria group bacterium]
MKIINTVPIIWENSVDNFDPLNVKDFQSKTENFTEEFNKEFPLKDVEIHISQPSKEEGFDTKRFHVKLHIHLKNGKLFFSKGEDRNINLALSTAIREIRKQSDLSDSHKHDLNSHLS